MFYAEYCIKLVSEVLGSAMLSWKRKDTELYFPHKNMIFLQKYTKFRDFSKHFELLPFLYKLAWVSIMAEGQEHS